ncbi:hypothetical protein [Nonomuraea sp. NPDC049709]
MTVTEDRRIKVELARHAGRMHWLGFDTRRTTSVREQAPAADDHAAPS